jgi:hypothetical protein
MNMKETIAKLGFLLMLVITVFSCSPTGKHPRKKLPATLDDEYTTPELPAMNRVTSFRKKLTAPTNEWSDLCPSAQKTQDNASCSIAETTIAGKSYYSVQISGGTNDEAIMDIIKLYRPFAGSVVDMLLRDGKEGALIDCSGQEGRNTERAEFLVKNDKGRSFSVIFIWDTLSAGRASTFMNELQQLSGITSIRK